MELKSITFYLLQGLNPRPSAERVTNQASIAGFPESPIVGSGLAIRYLCWMPAWYLSSIRQGLFF